MKAATPRHELELLHRQLVHSLSLPDGAMLEGSPAFLRQLDMPFVRQLLGLDRAWTADNAFDDRERIVADVFLASDEGRQLHLASEIDLLRKVKETGDDQLHQGPFDILELVLPVKVRGAIIHILRSGKFRQSPFSAADLKELGFVTGVPAAKVKEAADALPVFQGRELESWVSAHKRGRDAAVAAVEEHLRANTLGGQQLQTERLVALGTMAEGMAHHFSNLLSVILGYTSLVVARSELSPEAAEALKMTVEAAQKGRRFTEEILTVAGEQPEEEAACSLHDRITAAIALLQSSHPTRVRAETHLEAAHDVVLAPPSLVHQMVFNLLGAALDSLPQGGALVIRTSNPGQAEAGHVRIEVTESGAPRNAPAIREGGAAPGTKLASLLGQVGRLDGTVTSGTGSGAGVRIVVTLPVSTEPAAVRPTKKVRRRLAPSSIWIADDDPVVREMCRRVLETEGHTVAESGDGADVQRRLQGKGAAPDLIVYDFTMPDVDGYEFCAWLRENGHRVPVILISGFGADHPAIKKTLKLRKTFLLQKPFSFRDMSDMVTIAMGETLVDA